MPNLDPAPMPVLAQYVDCIRKASIADISADPTLAGQLHLVRSGSMVMSYAPFETINEKARIVLVGITPGRRQATDALLEARLRLIAGADPETAARCAKATASFAGAMRSNIVAMLDHLGLPAKLGLPSTSALFGSHAHLVHYTSALRYPVWVSGRDYAGSSPRMEAHPQLRNQILATLYQEAQALPEALWIPLGAKVGAALELLVHEGILPRSRILSGLPHASGANAERIAYFLGRKPRIDLSVKTDPIRIDSGRALALATVMALPTMV